MTFGLSAGQFIDNTATFSANAIVINYLLFVLDKNIQTVSVPEKSFLDDGKIGKDPGLNWTNIACDKTIH